VSNFDQEGFQINVVFCTGEELFGAFLAENLAILCMHYSEFFTTTLLVITVIVEVFTNNCLLASGSVAW